MESESCREMKAALRQRLTALRDALSPAEREAASRAIRERLFALPEWAEARTLFVYLAFRSEVSTREIVAAAWESGRRVLAPRVERGRREMSACEIRSAADLAPGTWGILEPRPEKRAAEPTEIDLVLAPGLAFDLRGGRLGYGAGYYDEYLPRLRPDCVRAALAYEAQCVPEVPCEPTDARLHLLITEARIQRFHHE